MRSTVPLMRRLALLGMLGILLTACAAPSAPSPATPTPDPGAVATGTPVPLSPTVARQYTLTEAEVSVGVGDGVVEALQLRGTFAAPAEVGPYPIVVVLHGSHAVCPPDPRSPEEPEICPQATQFRNDPGLGYLLEALAAQGMIALAPDLNTVFRAEFGGFAQQNQRVQFVIERHLEQLAANNPAFGLPNGFTGDPTRIYLIGHSQGGTSAFELAETWAAAQPNGGAWGPVRGLLLLAPPVPSGIDLGPPLDLPLAVVLPECDGDVSMLDGQHYVEAARLDPGRRSPAVSYFLPGANHNFFNSTVEIDDSASSFSRCLVETPRLPREVQANFLANLAPSLLLAWEAGVMKAIPGFDLGAPLFTTLYDAPTVVMPVYPAAQRRLILPGVASSELTTSPLGGAVQTERLELDFCAYGMAGNGSPCRQGVHNPGLPAQLHLAWEEPAASLRVSLPEAFADATQAQVLQLRFAVDPLDRRAPANVSQPVRVTLRDRAGGEAMQIIEAAFPLGTVLNEQWFGHVFVGTARLALAGFAGVDLSQLSEVLLQPETQTGSLFLADLELIAEQASISGPAQPSPFRSLSGMANVPGVSSVPDGSALIMRLVFAGMDGGNPRFVTIQSMPVVGTPPFPFALRYHQAALDERFDYVLDANLILADGQAFVMPAPIPALVGGVAQAPLNLELVAVVAVEPTPVPTDATFRLTIQAPAGQPFPPEALIDVSLSRLDASGMGMETLAGINATVGAEPTTSLVVEVPYASRMITPGASYGLGISVFESNGFVRLAESDGNVLVDLATNEATITLLPVAP